MRMDDIKGGVGESQLVDIPNEQPEIPHTLRSGQGLGCHDRGRCGIDADHPALREPPGEIDGNGPGTDAKVEQPVCRVQVREQIRRGVVGGPPAVRSKDRIVVSM